MCQRNRHGSGDAISSWPLPHGQRWRFWAKAIAAGSSLPWRWAWMSPQWRMRWSVRLEKLLYPRLPSAACGRNQVVPFVTIMHWE